MRLKRHSERYSPTGSLASEGALNQLGRPNLDSLNVLVREAVQNIWDARTPEKSGAVVAGFHGMTLAPRQVGALQDCLRDLPPAGSTLGALLEADEPIRLLCISDRGTVGLGGPTRADVDPRGESTNFVNLLRNVGIPPRRPLGGGTFGYGKTALFLASQVRTVIAHSHSTALGKPVRRLMVAALGEDFTAGGQRHTGRHWWGTAAGPIVDPVEGADADRIAERLALPAFASGERGTTVAILQPDFGERDPVQALNYIALCLLWNFWPKMLARRRGSPAIRFELSWDGRNIPLPRPEKFPPLNGFVEAMAKIKTGTRDVIPVTCERPRQALGKLALERFTVLPREPLTTLAEEESAWPIGRCHHVALMRQAELVVKYIEGPPLPTSAMEYAGVFIAEEDMDDVFARSEPPSHDEWAYRSLQDSRERSFVRVALRRVHEALDHFTAGQGTGTGELETRPLGGFADHLGHLLLGTDGPSASVRTQDTGPPSGGGANGGTGKGSGAGRRGAQERAAVEIIEHRLELVAGKPAVVIRFSVSAARGSTGTLVKTRAGAILDGNELELDPPAGAQTPRVLGWTSPGGKRHDTETVVVPASTPGPWTVIVAAIHDAVVGVSLSGEPRYPS